jgi:hypothetical protein
MGVRQDMTTASNGSVPGYSWAAVEAISGSPLVNPLNRNYTVTYTFSPAVPPNRLILGVGGLGRTSDGGGDGPAESNIKVEANGSTSALTWQMLGDWAPAAANFGATEIRNAANTGAGTAGTPVLLRNSQINAGGANPWWNSKFAVLRMNQAVSSLTLTVNHVRGDGFSFAIGSLAEGCWQSGPDLAAAERETATETQNPNAVVPQWSYGYRADIASTAFTAFNQHFNLTSGFSAGVEGFETNLSANTPHVRVNPSSAPIVRAPMLNLDPEHMEVHPGPANGPGDVVVVRFTAPVAGTYMLSSTWRDNNSSSGGTNGGIAAVVHNGADIYNQRFANGAPSFSYSNPSIILAANDKLDFVVDADGDYNSDSTDLDAEVCLLAPGEIGITDNGTSPTTDLVDNVTQVKFDCVAINTSSTRSLNLRNDGTGVLNISAVTKSGLNANDFIVMPNLVGTSVAAGSSVPFTIKFTPTSSGLKQAKLHITSNDANGDETVFDIPLTGCGCIPEISIYSDLTGNWLTDNVGSVKFGTVQTCSTGLEKLYIFNESCDCDLTVSAWSITGTNAAEFQLASPPSLPATLPSGPLTLCVNFAPTSPGVKNAVLRIISDDPNETSFEIILTGTAVGPNIKVNQQVPALTVVNGGSVSPFGSVASGGTIVRTYKIYNNGNPGSTLMLGTPTVSPAGPFTVSALSTSSISGAGFSQFTVTFTASAPPACHGATIMIPSNDCNEASFTFNVEATSGTTVAPVFTTHPANQIAYLGEPASFTATATCACPVTYDWFNGFAQPAGTGQILGIQFAKGLPLPQDLQFAARAICDGKTTMSNTANLTVVNCLPYTPAQRNLNTSVSFTAQAWNATGYRWRKVSGSGSPLVITAAAIPGATAGGFNTAVLTLSSLQLAAAGEYVCDVSGHPGTVPLPTKPFKLVINESAITLPPNAVGSYGGVIERGVCNGDHGGCVGFTITPTGAVSAAGVKLGGISVPLTLTQQTVVAYSTATVSGVLTNSTVVPPVSVEFSIDVATRRFNVGPLSRVTRYGSSSGFQGWRKEAVPGTIKGLYNYTMDTPAITTLPQGWSWGSFTLSPAGTYSISGRTACDEAFTFSMFASPGTAPSNKHEVAIFSMQPSGSSLVGIYEITAGTPNLLQNSSLLPPTWRRPASSLPIYGAGFAAITMTTEGGLYTLATPRVMGVPAGANNALANFTDGGLPPPSGWNPDRYCSISAANYTLPAILNEKTTFIITGSTGLITKIGFGLLDPLPYAPTSSLVTRRAAGTGIVIPLAAGGQEGRGYFMLNELAPSFGAPLSTLSGGLRVH